MMLKRVCKYCYEGYTATDSTADRNIWGFCSKKCERLYDVWEDRLRTQEIQAK
jgi:ribosomal protein L24E